MSRHTPYGSWKSPITAGLIAANQVSLYEPRFSGDHVYWLEGRPGERGRVTIVRCDPGGTVSDAIPNAFNVRTRVHEYGGGAYAVHEDTLFFSDDASQRLYRQDPEADAIPITPEPGEFPSVRYADGTITPDGRWIVCVRETHHADKEPTNDLALVPTDGSSRPRRLVEGHDFYSFPRVSLGGSRLVWTTWDHPRMPWDGTDLWVADFGIDGELGPPRHVAGGPEESVFQPEWGADGAIYFVSDRTGWWNLYADRDGALTALAPMAAEFGGPQWVFGLSRYALLGEDRLASVYTRNGIEQLAIVDVKTNEIEPWSVPYSSIPALTSDRRNRVAFVGASASVAPELATAEMGSSSHHVLRRSLDLEIDVGYLSEPEHIRFPSSGDGTAYAFFYPPVNKDHNPVPDERPPLIVTSHGGPTSSTSSSLNLSIQFWTSRGFGVVDVNYRVSTGYGRAYRDCLKNQWGVVDTEDCLHAARYLADQGKVDRSRMAIRGKSASGFTVMSALVFHDVFAAGASYYGVTDLEALVRDTHKFEARYLDSLIGPYPEMANVYQDRSPLRHAESLRTPIILLQGMEDPVVPPAQSELLVSVLRRKGLPFAYVTFEGERHGFRRAASIRRALEAELYFYSRILDFEPADRLEPVPIENLK